MMKRKNIWEKSNIKKSINSDDVKAIFSNQKTKNGKTKRELIQEFFDYKGDKYVYLIENPLTRVAFSVGGNSINQWNNFNSVENVFATNYWSPIQYTPGVYENPGAVITPAGYCFFLQSQNQVKFPVQFGILASPNSNAYRISYNLAFSSLINYRTLANQGTVLSNGSPFTFGPDTGFCLSVITQGDLSTSWTGMNYASASNLGVSLAGATQYQVPGLATSSGFFTGNPTVYFRFFSSGNKIGWSTNGTSWTYWTPPITYNTTGLYMTHAWVNLANLNFFNAGQATFRSVNVPSNLANLP